MPEAGLSKGPGFPNTECTILSPGPRALIWNCKMGEGLATHLSLF